MVQRLPAGYVLDPADPRAPTSEQWDAMTPAERDRVLDMLPTSLPANLQRPRADLSEVLGLNLEMNASEHLACLGEMLDETIALREEAERRNEELAAKLDEEHRLREEEHRLREDAERRLAEAEAEIARLKQR